MPRKSKKPVRKQTQSPTGEVVGRNNVAGLAVNGDVQLAPCALLWRFAGGSNMNPQARAIDHQVDGLTACGFRNPQLLLRSYLPKSRHAYVLQTMKEAYKSKSADKARKRSSLERNGRHSVE